MNRKQPLNMSRRRVLQGIATLMATAAMPAQNIEPILTELTAGWEMDLIKILPIIYTLNQRNILCSFNTMQDVQNAINQPHAHDLSHLAFSKRLGMAWNQNLKISVDRERFCQQFDQIKATHFDVEPRLFFSMLEKSQCREQIANALYQQHMRRIPFRVERDSATGRNSFGWIQETIDNILQLSHRYPSLRTATSWEPLISGIRCDITAALQLSLEDGCLDVSMPSQNTRNLQFLLNEAHALLPQDKVAKLKAAAEDRAIHGKQTIRFKDISKPHYEWVMEARNLFYHFGLTSLQNIWGIEAVESDPSQQKLKSPKAYWIKPLNMTIPASPSATNYIQQKPFLLLQEPHLG